MALSISSKTEFQIDAIDTFLDSRIKKVVSAALFCSFVLQGSGVNQVNHLFLFCVFLLYTWTI